MNNALERSDTRSIESLEALPPYKGEEVRSSPKDAQFWLIVLSISLISFLVALDMSILSTALPSIASDLHSEDKFVWVINSYLIACTSTAMISAQLSDLFGRRWVTIPSVLIFAAGSAVCGAARTTEVLIGGRTLQGVGAGGIFTMGSIIMCDIVPMRERGFYNGIINSVRTLANVMGPPLGGGLTQFASWRWIFYLNLPFSALATIIALAYLRLQSPQDGTVMQRLAQIDWIGCGLVSASTTLTLLAMEWAGTKYPWASWEILVPLLSGFSGLGAFVVYQASPMNRHPVMPLRLLSNRTAASAYAMMFLQSVTMFWIIYFLPVYFQAVLTFSPAQQAIVTLPSSLMTVPAAIAAGVLVAMTGKYRGFHFLGFALLVVTFGLFGLLDAQSPAVEWICYQIPFAIGTGVLLTTLLPAVLASLAEEDVAAAAGLSAFLRNYGFLWGAAIPSAIFDQRVTDKLPSIHDVYLTSALSHGAAFSKGTKEFMDTLRGRPAVFDAAQNLYVSNLKELWYIGAAFAGAGFLLSFFVRGLPLRKTLDTKYGVDRKPSKTSTLDST